MVQRIFQYAYEGGSVGICQGEPKFKRGQFALQFLADPLNEPASSCIDLVVFF